MSGKRKDKDNLSSEASSKKSKVEAKRKRNSPPCCSTESTNNEYFKETLSRLNNLELNKTNLTEIIDSILKRNEITNRQDESLLLIFKKIIKKNELDSEMFLFLLELLNNDFLTKHRHLCEFLISSLFMIEHDQKSPQILKSKPIKIFKFKPQNLNDLIKHSINLLQISNFYKQTSVYLKLFKIFVLVDFKNEKYLKDKFVFIKAEKLLLEKLVERLKNDPTGLIGSEILRTFKTIVAEYSVKTLNNNFLIKVYLSIINELNEKVAHNMTSELIKLLENGFEVQNMSTKSWPIKKCLDKLIDTKKFIDLFNYNHLIQFIPQDKLITNSIEFCLSVFNLYGIEINKYFENPKTLEEYFTYLATRIINELFRKSKQSREQILSALLNRSFTDSNRLVFISQLEILLNSDDSLHVFYSSVNQEEKSNLCKMAISKLVGQSSSKTRAWNHIFLIDKSNDAIRLLKAFRVMFYTANKTTNVEHFDNLINFLRSYTSNNSLEVRKIAILGLANLVVELNRDHFNVNSYEIKVSHESCVSQNSTISLNIIEHLSNQLNSYETDLGLKSNLYQILYSSVEIIRKLQGDTISLSQSKIFDAVGSLYKTQLEKYVIRTVNSDYVYFNLNKCLNNEFKLIEPIDVLFHCADLYSTNCLKMISSGNIAFRTLSSIQFQMTQLKKIYLEKDSKFLFDIYKNQLMDRVKLQTSPAACMKIIHQLELGFIDVLLEHSVNNEFYSDLTKILEKYESTSNLISIEIENMMSSLHKPQLESSGKKRKLESSVSTTQKKAKKVYCLRPTVSHTSVSESNDKENEPAVKTRSALTRPQRETLQDLSNKQTIKKTELKKPTLSVIQNLSFANIQFEHVHRISFNCCLKMVQMYLGTNETDIFKSSSSRISHTVLGTLINLITNETFIEFLIKVMEKKLKIISNMDKDEYYDPQSRNDEQIFSFLCSLWLALCQRINGNLTSKKTVYKPNIPQRFGVQFLNKSHRFIQCLQLIWSICCNRFQSKKKELLINERKYYTNFGYENYLDQNDESKINEIYWEFLKNCSRTLKYHLNTTPSTQSISNKCCLALLTLISDITRETKLKEENYNKLMQFLFDLSDHRISCEQDFGLCLFKFLREIAENSNTPLLVSKFLSIEYANTRYLDYTDDTDDEPRPIDETTKQFRLFDSESSFLKYQQIINDQITESLEQFKWCLLNSKLFNQDFLLQTINTQIDYIVLSIHYILKSVFDPDTAKVNFELMIKFYQFLTFYIQSDFVLNLTCDGTALFKELIDRIAIFLQSILSDELNRINEFILTDEQQKEEVTNSAQIIDIIKYKENMELLISSIDQFERELIRINDLNDYEINLIKNYKNFVSSLELTVKSRSTRFVSAVEIDQILNPKVY